MLTLTTEERLALLLNVLGSEASAAAFKSMNPTRAKYVGRLLEEYKIDPPSRDEIEYVVHDFNNYFSFAMDALGPQISLAAENARKAKSNVDSKNNDQGASPTKPTIRYFDAIELTGNAVEDLNRLDPFQIVSALVGDHPKTIAIVLRKLDTKLAAAVISQLPEETRTDSVVFLSEESTVPDRIVDQVIGSTLVKANSVTCQKEETDRAQILAELMRSLPKEMRKQLIERLTEENPDLVEEVRAKLYIFDDLLRLSDRDIQKILGEVETDVLIVALQRADMTLTKRLLSNLSKRARQTIEEEMQYKTGVSIEEVEEARTQLVETLAKLDESGEVTLT